MSATGDQTPQRPCVDILLATYNGGRWITAQLDSLQAQTYTNYRVIVLDDASTDGVCEQIAAHSLTRSGRLVLHRQTNNRGAWQTFSALMQMSTAPYVFFCDQDDLWLPDKIDYCVRYAEQLLAVLGEDVPLLVHTDLRLIDCDGRVLQPSLWNYQRLDPKASTRLADTLIQNQITGCAMMANRALLAAVGTLPDGIVMHDWYLGLCAAAFGHVLALAEPTVHYRQHGHNELGAQSFGWRALLDWQRMLEVPRKARSSAIQVARQAQVFGDHMGHLLNAEQTTLVQAVAQLGRVGYWRRRYLMARYRLWKQGGLKNLAWLIAG